MQGTVVLPALCDLEEHSMTYSLENKHVLIVGGSSDIAGALATADQARTDGGLDHLVSVATERRAGRSSPAGARGDRRREGS
jgi:NAD(P)H-hydrate repair Nnr-like enzyme with NAD(P)H-hydrate dehydratase domain